MRYVTPPNKYLYWQDLAAIRKRENLEWQHESMVKFIREHYGFEVLQDNVGITDTYCVVDEAKYLLWLLKKY